MSQLYHSKYMNWVGLTMRRELGESSLHSCRCAFTGLHLKISALQVNSVARLGKN